jgi:hypothetical protein
MSDRRFNVLSICGDEKSGEIKDPNTTGFIKQQLAAFAKFIARVATGRALCLVLPPPKCGESRTAVEAELELAYDAGVLSGH